MAEQLFDKGQILSSRDLGFDGDYEIHVARNFEGGWTATCPTVEMVENGDTREEAIANLLENMRVHKSQVHHQRDRMPPPDKT